MKEGNPRLKAQREAAMLCRARNRHLTLINQLLGQVSVIDTDLEKAVRKCSPDAEAMIRAACERVNDALVDTLSEYVLSTGNPFIRAPKSKPESEQQ